MKKILLTFYLVFSSITITFAQVSPKCLTCVSDTVVVHKLYSLSYNEYHEQANWTVYSLTPSMAGLYDGDVFRANIFKYDPLIKSKSANTKDYEKSGYDRGHLIPAEDMDINIESMVESFYTSNISPQLPGFNRGIWKSLEYHIRRLGMLDTIQVYTGPVLTNKLNYIQDYKKKDGTIIKRQDRISIPKYFWKIIYSKKYMTYTAWLIPNEETKKHITDFEITIYELEKITGITFSLSNVEFCETFKGLKISGK